LIVGEVTSKASQKIMEGGGREKFENLRKGEPQRKGESPLIGERLFQADGLQAKKGGGRVSLVGKRYWEGKKRDGVLLTGKPPKNC